ncbi:MAG: hypothetical protein RBT19_06480 [Tenuifilaceae bacterium]|jgi:hypothetical protein|nr:hypothetical protein [Tenuifilaceae bacterium]
MKDIKDSLKELNNLIIVARYNHIFLYDRNFWRIHLKTRKLIKKNRNYKFGKLKISSVLIWLNIIPLLVIMWFVGFFILLVALKLDDSDRTFLFLVNFPHTIFIFWLYHKLANRAIKRYHRKIRENIKILD